MNPHQEPEKQELSLLDEVRDRMPELHPYTALILTIDLMLVRGEISTEEYQKYAAGLVASRRKPLFTHN